MSGHGFSPIMSNMVPHPDGLRKALFPQHDRPGERKSSMTRVTPFSGAPSTFMEDVTSPTTANFNSPQSIPYERRDLVSEARRDQPIVAPKSPTPPILQQQQHQPPLPPPPPQGPIEPPSRQFILGPPPPLGPPVNFHPGSAYTNPQLGHFHSHSPSSFLQQLPHLPQSLHATSTSPNGELSSFLPQPTTPTMPRRKGSDKSKQAPKAASAASASTTSTSQQRISVGNKSQPPPSPQAGTARGENSIPGKDHPPPSPATPMIKRRSAYVAGGGIKTTDLALPKPDVVELTAPPPDQPLGTPVDTEQMLMINKPRKRNKANPSVLRTREKEVDDAMTAAIEDLDGQPGREIYEVDMRSEEPEERSKEPSKEAEPPKVRQKRARRSKMDMSDDEDDEYVEDVIAPSPPPAAKKPRRSRFTKSAPSVVSEETATEEEQQPPLVLGKRARKATTRAIKAAEQSTKRRCTRKTEADEAGTLTDYISATSGTESVAPEPLVEKRPPVRRGRKPRAKGDKGKEKEKENEKEKEKDKDKESATVDETTSEGESTGEQAHPQLIVNGKPIRVPTPPPSFKKPGLVGWYRCRERPKFTEGDEYLDSEHTIRRLNDWYRLHRYRTSQPFFKMPSLIDEDGWTDTEQELEKMGRSKPTDAKAQKTILWDSKISDAAFEKGFEQLERKGSVEPLSAAETPKNDFLPEPPTASRQPTSLSYVENAKEDGDATDVAIDEAVLSTAVATPMADFEGELFPTKEKTQEVAESVADFLAPTHSFGFDTMRGAVLPKQDVYKHTERKKKNKGPVEDSARNLKGVKWIVPLIEGRPAEILKQTWDWQTEQRKIKEKAEAEAAALAALEDPNGEKPKKRGGRRGKKKTKGDLKNLAYAREVRRAKLEGAKIHTPDEDNLSVASEFLAGDGGDVSDVTIDDDYGSNSDHSSDWSADEDEPETPRRMEMEKLYQEAIADPAKKAFMDEWIPRLFPNLYELPPDETRNRGPDFVDADEFGAAIDMAIDIDDQELLQSAMTHATMQYAMVVDEKTRLDSYQVKRGFLKPETVLRRANKRRADDAGLDDGDDGPGPRYSTRRRTVKNPDADDQIGMTGYSTPRAGGPGSFHDAQTPEREVRAYKPRGGRGSRGGGRGGAKIVKQEGPVPVNPITGLPTSGPGSRGGRGRGGGVRGSRGGRGRGRQVT
ncbi:hypothetical protein TWF718_006576 [Orbilia javanica]|uniref:Uncharacterized protein n=1 Tax=Orbilia javanica TaxID=47235 RepID=A0AAN8MX34_9PEZI